MNKQTAVEWLVDELLDSKPLMPSLIEQAKAMEKEQIMEAYWHGSFNWETQGSTQFYNEKYGGDK
jgi:Leu/Phe-tRNA-protein transferase